MTRSNQPDQRVILLGSTGSIGTSTLQVIDHLRRLGRCIDVVGLAAGCNATLLADQAAQYNVTDLALADGSKCNTLSSKSNVRQGIDAAEQLIRDVARPGDIVVAAMVGAAGVPATLAAIESGCRIALANKEALVAAGALVMPAVRRAGIELLPIDSEHSALLQCLAAGRTLDEVRRVVITASGGPFRTWSAARMARATIDEALAHPTWTMGHKITIDSATLMNKVLEIVEAHWLFGLSADQIDAVMHPQSIIHGLVEFIDGSTIAQMGRPDMKLPIQYALTWPDRVEGETDGLDWSQAMTLDFEPIDPEQFPAIRLARRIIDTGGTAGAILNAANEEAVMAFLAGRIAFGQIVTLVESALDAIESVRTETLEAIQNADQAARAHVQRRLDADTVKRPGRSLASG